MQPCETKTGSHSSHFFASAVLALAFFNPTSANTVAPVTFGPKTPEAVIQQSLDNLPPGGEIVLAPGQYEISKPLFLRHDRQSLRGSGPTTILRLADNANCPAIVIGPPLDDPKRRVGQVRVSDLLIDGNRFNQKTEHWKVADDGSEINNNGVHVWNADDAAVERVICCRCRSGGLVSAAVRHLRVANFRAYDNQYDGLACYQTEQSAFSGVYLHDNLAAGISLDLGFNHNVITNVVLTSNDLGIFMRDSRANVFRDLTISKSRHDGVFMAQALVPTASGWELAPNTECTGNSFVNLTVRDCGGHAFQVNDASCTNNTITGASFQRNAKGGLGQPASHPMRLIEVATR